jgi:alginate O-acetyltransferase complex protein AlgI
MVFSSWLYVCFLALVFVLYWTLPQRCKIPLLLLASYGFYAAWSPPFGLIYAPFLLLDSLYFYYLSVAMRRWPAHAKSILWFGISTELCVLGYFKYANFLATTADAILNALHLPATGAHFSVFLPLAISFTNFVLISYLVDVYRGDEDPDPSVVGFATYVAFFPHLIAGPIVRAKELLHQLRQYHPFNPQQCWMGIDRFLTGLALKLLVADTVAPLVDRIFSTPALQGFDTTWAGIYAFAVQIFCDFAGYTLMAQGSALLLGLTLPDNFNAPYFARNIQDFWRRWHMSLSRWLRDYVYIPLGGSRGGSQWSTSKNLFLTMALGGLWHGANWTFVVWGVYQGLLLSGHKLAVHCKLTKLVPGVLAWFITFNAVCVGWVFFRASSFAQAWHYLGAMATPTHWVGLKTIEGGVKALVLAVGFLVVHALYRRFNHVSVPVPVLVAGKTVAYGLLFYLCLTLQNSPQSFIYFQF